MYIYTHTHNSAHYTDIGIFFETAFYLRWQFRCQVLVRYNLEAVKYLRGNRYNLEAVKYLRGKKNNTDDNKNADKVKPQKSAQSHLLKQGCQIHFHLGPHQPCGCLQRVECNFRTV